MLSEKDKQAIRSGAKYIVEHIPNATPEMAKETFVIVFDYLNEEEVEEAYKIIEQEFVSKLN